MNESAYSIAALWQAVAQLSVNDPGRLGLLLAEARRQAFHGDGDFIEMGVYRGGTALLLAHALREQGSSGELHLLDSWQGMPPPTTEDGQPLVGQGFFADASEAGVRQALTHFGLQARSRNKVGSFGLVGIEERISILGGQCSISGSPNAGTVVHVSVPLECPSSTFNTTARQLEAV